jgi:alpha-L-fucosidase 2
VVNLWARLEQGDNAYENLLALLRQSTYPNLFDDVSGNVFQIDGNFGGTAGIAEMLLQSHTGEIELLPALPHRWEEGYIKGLRARGGFEVEIFWSEGKLKEDVIKSLNGNPCKIRYGGNQVEIKTESGKNYMFDSDLKILKGRN